MMVSESSRVIQDIQEKRISREGIIKQVFKVEETGEGRWNRSCELIVVEVSVKKREGKESIADQN